ncbi:MAG: acetoin utilization protein AcuC [Actinomycetota bacterium]|nr:acetoin utilization protein AcuC [Actinomycetota bacterium]
MSESLHVVWDPSFLAYDFGPSHPLAPVRVDLTIRLADELGLLDLPHVTVADAPVADEALLGLVHDLEYVAAVREVSADPLRTDLAHGLGTDDNPVFAGMHEASARVLAGSVQCARAVWEGRAQHGVNICGGLHHAMPAAASGFCIYNDAAAAIAWLLQAGVQRVAYVDVDVHHGDGVERIFWEDPRVLTISLHETGSYLFPGTGFAEDVGGARAEGCAVNVALPPGTGDAAWLRAFDAVVPPLLAEFGPQVLVSQQGCDSHFLDPLAHLALSVDAQRTSYARLHELAHQHADGRWIALGGGGYEVVDVVPRAWAHLIAEAAGRPVEPTRVVPEDWRRHVQQRYRRQGPGRMTDGRTGEFDAWSRGCDPGDAIDRVVLATRQAAFPLHGLDPLR